MTSPLDFCMLCGAKPSRPDGDFCSNTCYVETREAIIAWNNQKVNKPAVWHRDTPEYLHRRIDKLENVLMSISIAGFPSDYIQHRQMLEILKDAGIVGNVVKPKLTAKQVDEHDVPEAMEMQKEMNKGKELK